MKTIKIRRVIASDAIQRQAYGYTRNLVENCGFNKDLIGDMTAEQSEVWYESILKHPCKWIIKTDRMIGTISLRVNENDHKAKLAIEIYDDHSCGLGIGSKVINEVLNYAFQVLNLNKVYLRVLDTNTRAIKCYLNCGFIEEGRDRKGSFLNGEYCTDIYMSILKSEYHPKPSRGDSK